ncbi:MAG: sugar phosphate isomerase/epimerase [Chloroflexi bacterium]|nr:sugar phosphate isomerase/epimerase [Chloroflexota bacterium]
MKFSVFTVMMPEYTPQETVRILSELGYDGVEWRVTMPGYDAAKPTNYWSNNRCTIDIASIDKQAAQIAEMTRSAGLQTCALGTYMGIHQLGDIERALRAAAEMGCPRIRVSPPGYNTERGYFRLFGESVAAYVDVQKLARKYSVQACLEIHMGNICSSPSLAYLLLNHFDPRYIGVILDPGNMVYEGYEDWPMGIELLGPYLTHVHLKNSRWVVQGKRETGEAIWKTEAAATDQGVIDMRRFMDSLRAADYTGYCSFEDFSDTGTTREKLERNIRYIRSI